MIEIGVYLLCLFCHHGSHVVIKLEHPLKNPEEKTNSEMK